MVCSMVKKTNDALVNGMIAFLLYFIIKEVLEGFNGWNADASYATLFNVLTPIGIALYVALSSFGGHVMKR